VSVVMKCNDKYKTRAALQDSSCFQTSTLGQADQHLMQKHCHF